MVSKPKLFNALLMGSACLNVAASFPAYAQGATSGGALSEVFVTARRQDENVQSIPVAMTVVSEESLKNLQIHNMTDVQRGAPNLSISAHAPATSGFVFIGMRGLTNLQAGTENDPAVAIYLDGVFIASPAMGLLDFNDVQNIEVLRGPQGTLFGRAAIGGALNITTNQPTQNLEGSLQAEVGNFETRNINGMINVPLTDNIAARFVAHHKEHSGYGKNETTGGDLRNQLGDDYVRGQVLFDINDNWNFTLSGQWNRMEDDGLLINLSDWADPTSLFGAFGVDLDPYVHNKSNWYDGHGSEDSYDYLKTSIYTGTLNGDLGWATMKSITAYQRMYSYGGNDLDTTPYDILYSVSTYDTETFTQELQFSGEMDRFNWIAGLYYLHLTGTEESVYRSLGFASSIAGQEVFPGAGEFYPANIGGTAVNYGIVDSDSYAAFLQTYYELTDNLKLSAGIRWTRDVRDVTLRNFTLINNPDFCASPGPVGTVGDCRQSLSKTFEYPAYTLGLDYQLTPDILLYAKTSRAALAGGFNLRQGGGDKPFDPEVVKDIEIGVKADWLDHRLRTNLALFHTWRTDTQNNAAGFIEGQPTQFVINSGDAQVDGLELDVIAAPWDGMEITASIGLLDTEYDKGTFRENQSVTLPYGSAVPAGCSSLASVPPGVTVFLPDGAEMLECDVDRSGETPNLAPELTYNIGFTQTVPLSFGDLKVHLDYAYIDDQSFSEVTAADAQPAEVKALYARTNELARYDGYGLLNGLIALNISNPNVEIALWCKNMLDEKYVAQPFADIYSSLGMATEFVGDPRTYGLSLTYRFD